MRVLNYIGRRCFAPVNKQNDDVSEKSDDVRTTTITFTHHHHHHRRSYEKLPPLPLLKLSVLKLDGSVFEIYVGRTATIAEIKQAVEEVFGSLQGKIPWSLVWGHFCLCYVGQKLTNDKACIRNFGIKDGDQLQFIRYMSVSNSPLERRSKNDIVPYKQHLKLTYGSIGHEEEEKSTLESFEDSAVQEENTKYNPNEDLEEVPASKFKVVNYLRGWFSYSKIMGGIRKRIRRQESSIEIQPTFFRVQKSTQSA